MTGTIQQFRVEASWPERTARFQASIAIAGLTEGAFVHLAAGKEGDEASVRLIVPIPAGKQEVVVDEEVEIPNAAGWSPETPTMYWATLQCVLGDTTLARSEAAFRFRQFGVSEGRFRVGGKWFPVRAALLVSGESLIERELVLLKDLGFNTIVVSRHHAQAVLPIADRIGLAVLVASLSGELPESEKQADDTELPRHPSFLGQESEDGVLFMDLGWDQVADLGRRGVQQVTSTYAVPRPDGRPVIVRAFFPSPSEETYAPDEARFAAEGLAILRVARGLAGYCVSLRTGESWAERFPEGVEDSRLHHSYLPVIHGVTVLILRMSAKQFLPGDRAEVAISLINPGEYTGDGILTVCDVAPDRTRRTFRQPVHITKSSRSFSPVTLTAPAQYGRWETEASLIADDGRIIGRAIPWCVHVTAAR